MRIWRMTLWILFVFWFPNSGRAEIVPKIKSIECGGNNVRTVFVDVEFDRTQEDLFDDKDEIDRFLSGLARAAGRYCGGQPKPRERPVALSVSSSTAVFVAGLKLDDPSAKWELNNGVGRMVAERKRRTAERQAAAASAEQIKAEKAARLAAFMRKFDARQATNLAELTANPFQFKDKAVVLLARFYKMNSASEAMFIGDGVELLVVSDVPTTEFRKPDETILVAIKVTGAAPAQTPLGTFNAPAAKFLGAHHCPDSDCSDMR